MSNATSTLDGGASLVWPASPPYEILLGAMAAGASHTILIYADVDADLTGPLSNTATVSSDSGEPNPDSLHPNSDTCTNELTQVDVRLTLTPPTAVNQIGDVHTFTAKLEFDYGDGTGFVPAPDHELISFSLGSGSEKEMSS